MGYFSDRDRKLVEALRYDPTLEPGFELLKGCLVWADERPSGVTPDGWDKLCDLWIARSLLHQGNPSMRTSIGGDRFEKAWNEALRDEIQWPGFRRLILSAKDRDYFEASLRECEDGTAY